MITNQRPTTSLTTRDFYYDLPEELIAQTPAEPRDSARLLVADRASETLSHHHFRELTEFLRPEDTLVINDSKVIPARLLGIKEETGIGVELVLLRCHGGNRWETLVRPGRRCRPGTRLSFGEGLLQAEILETLPGGTRLVEFSYPTGEGGFFAVLDRVGQMPLPPYIHEKLKDRDRYQTVYAKCEGSAAAPTAGLHFTPELLAKIRDMGVAVVPVMLHVGLGTFRPVKVENIEEHEMHREYFEVTTEAANIINRRRAAGGRTICVGTTSCRTLESAVDDDGKIRPMAGNTGIFLYPGCKFRATDALITNFHLPESTLLMLVSALSSREFMMQAYAEAVRQRYRFFSFGDAMLIL